MMKPNLGTPAPRSGGADKFDDDQYPAYAMERAAEMLAARVRELVNQGTAVDAACRIVSLEDQPHESQRQNTELRTAE